MLLLSITHLTVAERIICKVPLQKIATGKIKANPMVSTAVNTMPLSFKIQLQGIVKKLQF